MFVSRALNLKSITQYLACSTALFSTMLSTILYAADQPKITVNGADRELTALITDHLRIKEQACDIGEFQLLSLRSQVKEDSLEAANSIGYYHSQISTDFSITEECWAADITIHPGERIVLNTITVNINGDEQTKQIFSELLNDSKLKLGSPLIHSDYEKFKSSLSGAAIENGFFSARFITSQIQLNLVANTADINIEFEPSERFRFGDIEFDSGDTFTNEFINKFIPIRAGDSYSSDELITLRENLDSSQYFQQIVISPQLSRVENLSVPINIQLTPRKKNLYSTGIGFTTDTGPRLRAAYENRYINKKGHRVRSDAAFSTLRSEISANYTIPLKNPLKESISFNAGMLTEDNDSFDNDQFKIESVYRNDTNSGWRRNLFVNHRQDNVTINNEDERSSLFILGGNISKSISDDVINPSKGWKIFTEIKFSDEAVFSDTSFIQLYANAKSIFPVGQRGRFISRLEAGSTIIDDLETLPASLRYFSGGDQSIRGFNYKSLGPTNDLNEVIGGNHLIAGSIEYDYRIKPKWRVAMFYDGGNAFADFDDIEWKQSVGFGIRWLSPIGPIRADIAHGFDADKSIRFHVTMGPDL